MNDKDISLNHQDVKILKHEVAYQGYFKIEKYYFKHRLFNGQWSAELERELFERGNAVGVLPYDPLLNKVILIEQFRIGTYAQTENPWLLEIVAGIIDKNETQEEVAHREVNEEAGLTIQKLIPICNYWVSPGGTTEKVKLFCAQVDARHAGGIHGLADEHEDIRVHVLNLTDAYTMLSNEKICNAATIIALQWLQLHEHWVKKQFELV